MKMMIVLTHEEVKEILEDHVRAIHNIPSKVYNDYSGKSRGFDIEVEVTEAGYVFDITNVVKPLQPATIRDFSFDEDT